MSKAMKNITQPYPAAFQVRIVKDRKERSRLFSFSHWGGKRKALKAAQSWRDQLYVLLDVKPNRKDCVQKNNLSTGVQGISKRIHTDKRRAIERQYLVYSVNWNDSTGKRRNKTFQVGNIEDYEAQIEELAFKKAKEFRKEYEKHWDNNTLGEFDTTKYLGWKDNLAQ